MVYGNRWLGVSGGCQDPVFFKIRKKIGIFLVGSQHIGRIYRFCVQEVLKGEGMEESIEISIPYSTTRSYRSKAADYTYVDPRFIEPELETEYLLFWITAKTAVTIMGRESLQQSKKVKTAAQNYNLIC